MLRFIYRVYQSQSCSGYLEIKLFLARGDEDETFQGSFSLSHLEWQVYKRTINIGDCSVTSKRTWAQIEGERIQASLAVVENFTTHEV